MKKRFLIMLFLVTLMMLPTTSVIAARSIDVNGNIVEGTLSGVPHAENNRKLHIRIEEGTLTLRLEGLPDSVKLKKNRDPIPLPLVVGEDYPVLLFEVQLNLRNNRAIFAWRIKIVENDEIIRYSFEFSGTGVKLGANQYKISVGSLILLQMGGGVPGIQYQQILKEKYPPESTYLLINTNPPSI